MLLLSVFSRENLTGGLSLSTLIKALRTVMERSSTKTRTLDQPMRRVSLLPVPPGRLGGPSSPAQLVRPISPPSLQRAITKLKSSQCQFLRKVGSAVGSTDMGTDSRQER